MNPGESLVATASRRLRELPRQTREGVQQLGRGLRAVSRLTPYDTSTPDGRSRERYRRAAISAATDLLSKLLGLFTGWAWVRIAIGYLGKTQFGLWMAATSLLLWAQLADFGMGRGLSVELSAAYGRDDREGAGRLVSTGFWALVAITAILGLLFLPIWWFTPWQKVLNVQDPSLVGTTRLTVGAVAAIFLANFPLSIVGVVYNAHQRGYVANLFSIAGSLASLAVLVAVTQLNLGLVWLIVAGGGAGVLVTTINFRWILREMPWLKPHLRAATWKTFRSLQSVSVALLFFQLGALAINQLQIIIISQRINLDAVADYGILMRVYALPTVVTAMVDAPMQTALREAYIRGEHDWVRQAFWRMTKLKMVIALGAAPLYPLLGNLVAWLLTGNAVRFDTRTWLATSALLIISIWNVAFNDLMIAVGRLWPLVWAIVGNAVVTVLATWWLAKPLGVFGVMIAYPIYSLILTAWLLPWLVRDVLWPRKPAAHTEALADGAS